MGAGKKLLALCSPLPLSVQRCYNGVVQSAIVIKAQFLPDIYYITQSVSCTFRTSRIDDCTALAGKEAK